MVPVSLNVAHYHIFILKLVVVQDTNLILLVHSVKNVLLAPTNTSQTKHPVYLVGVEQVLSKMDLTLLVIV
jgi:hypothetical protein